MGEAFDRAGQFLSSIEAETKADVLRELERRHGDTAHEIRIKTIAESFAPERFSPADSIPGAPDVQMPRYVCHKQVWALKIKDITDPTQPGNESDGSFLLHFEESGYGARRVGRDYVRKHSPERGGYFVVYKDGYESFSPAQAFEEGYALETAKARS